MQKILVLFNLKPGVDPAEYEDWARKADLPTARSLNAVTQFEVYRSEGLMGSGDAGPYQYMEWLEVTSIEALGNDAQAEAMQAIVAQFRTYADNPQFILMSNVE